MRIILVFTLLIPLYSFSQFRDAKWGWPPALVKQSEGIKEPRIDYSGDVITSLYYLDEKLGIYDVFIMYKFDKGVLVYGSYLLLEEYYDTQSHVEAFIDLKKNLTAKYGDPLQEDHTYISLSLSLSLVSNDLRILVNYMDAKYTLKDNVEPYKGL
ncbi:hypothetical protein [Parapedobacter sp. 10938]|uniref:hypothetical protein n=1 Tax=Parapedobacter flavus TaxID=3110225 RepID=UPI002DBCBD83|nr:hypothetical protein [Parapedobacter sp. 10938]MEC3881835.1 hypothetical protein [Parapedobacter sp. 10938]